MINSQFLSIDTKWHENMKYVNIDFSWKLEVCEYRHFPENWKYWRGIILCWGKWGLYNGHMLGIIFYGG